MNKIDIKDFFPDGNTLYWTTIAIFFFAIVCSYHIGYGNGVNKKTCSSFYDEGFKDGITKEKIEWLEQKQLDK